LRSRRGSVDSLAPANEALGRNRPAACNALEGKANIRGAAGFEGCIDEKLLEHVLLEVAAAESVHSADDRTHKGDGLGVASRGAGDLGLGDR
jgi:hypothetical protein